MQKQRLLKLASFLKTLTPERFDIRHWQSRDFDKDNCNTAACAWGWCPVVFPEAKLFTSNTEDGIRTVSYAYEGHLYYSFDGIEKFFGLTENQSIKLFCSLGYNVDHRKEITPEVVAQKIEDFVASNTVGEVHAR